MARANPRNRPLRRRITFALCPVCETNSNLARHAKEGFCASTREVLDTARAMEAEGWERAGTGRVSTLLALHVPTRLAPSYVTEEALDRRRTHYTTQSAHWVPRWAVELHDAVGRLRGSPLPALPDYERRHPYTGEEVRAAERVRYLRALFKACVEAGGLTDEARAVIAVQRLRFGRGGLE